MMHINPFLPFLLAALAAAAGESPETPAARARLSAPQQDPPQDDLASRYLRVGG